MNANRPESGVFASFDVDVGVTDNCSLFRMHMIFFEQLASSLRDRVFWSQNCFRHKSAKKRTRDRRASTMAREGMTSLFESTAIPCAGCPSTRAALRREGLFYAIIDGRVVKLVFAVVGEEKLQALAHNCVLNGLAAQCPLNQNRCAVAHVTGDHVVGQAGSSDMAKSRVDGVHQVEARVNERAVEIKDYELDGARARRPGGSGSCMFRINDEANCSQSRPSSIRSCVLLQ